MVSTSSLRHAAAFVDQAVDVRIHDRQGTLPPASCRQRQARIEYRKDVCEPKRLVGLGKSLAESTRLWSGQVHTHQGLPGDTQSQLGQVMVDLHRQPGASSSLPALSQVIRQPGDLVAKLQQALAVEGWLHQAALAQPQGAIAGQQTLAQHGSQHFVLDHLFVVIAGIVLQDMLESVRVAGHQALQAQDIVAYHVAMFAQ
jgi:hypothetical protein